jgi:hypothetical protein
MLSRNEQMAELSISPIPEIGDTIYQRFFLAAIAVVLTCGGTWGAMILWRIGIAHTFTGVSLFEIDAHGHAQIFGWVGLFIMGFAYQSFPRKWQTQLAAPRLAVAVFVSMIVGLIGATIAIASASRAWAAPTALAGGVIESVAIAVFAGQIFLTFRRSLARLEPWAGFVMSAVAFFVIQSIFSTWHTWKMMTAADEKSLLWYVSTYQGPLRDMQIHGMAMLMILGVNQRLLPAFYNVRPVPARRSWIALTLIVSSVVAETLTYIAFRWTGMEIFAALLLAPWLGLLVGTGLIAANWNIWRPLRATNGYIDRSGKFIRAAYIWLVISLVMLLLFPVYLAAMRMPFSHAYYGAVRHAITVGFISLMIMGFAAKVVPMLNAVDGRILSRLWGPFLLINLGCLLRVVLQSLTDRFPQCFSFVGISGAIEVTALAWWGFGLVSIMWRGSRGSPVQRRDCAQRRVIMQPCEAVARF